MPRPVVKSGLAASDAFPASAVAVGANVASYGMDHQVRIERNTATGTDPDGGAAAPVWVADPPIACLGIAERGDVSVIDDRTAALAARRVLVPAGTSVTTADRLGPVTRGAAVVLPGPMRIEAVNIRASFIELVVERVGSE